jgi:hypothetical protein
LKLLAYDDSLIEIEFEIIEAINEFLIQKLPAFWLIIIRKNRTGIIVVSLNEQFAMKTGETVVSQILLNFLLILHK